MDRLLLRNNVKKFIKDFAIFITENMLYPALHPNVIAQLKKTCISLDEIFVLTDSIYIDIVEKHFVFEGIPLYDLKHSVEKAFQLIESKAIESICFKKGVTQQNIAFFSSILIEKTRPLDADELQKELERSGITCIVIVKNVRAKDDDGKYALLKPEKIYGSSIEANKMVYNAVFEGKALPIDIIDKVSQDITSMVIKDKASGLATTTLRDYDEYTFTHSTNVAILSVVLATNIINDSELLSKLARAALLHDIGKIKIPISILHKTPKLTPDEWAILKQHSIMGAKILEEQDNTDMLAINIAAQHHMKFDLSGYPKIKGITEIHPLSLITSICDVYDAITSTRPYKNPISSDKAIALMLQFIGTEFDPYFLKIFAQMIGVYPPGTFVLLNNGEIAIVQNVLPHALLLPQIKIISGKNGTMLEEPTFIDLSNKDSNTSGRNISSVIDPKEHGIDALAFFT
ncbi:MAG: HD domain-containing protein [bacterium]|nr:HD domain-containing protein [bacterium]